MTWNNEIGLADIISILALLATFITVFLLFIQRHDSARPFVSIKIENKTTYAVSYTPTKESPIGIDNDAITINCSGSIAKGVDIESYFVLDKEIDFYRTIKISNGIGEVSKDGDVRMLFFLSPKRTRFSSINCNESISLTSELYGKLLGMAYSGLDAIGQAEGEYLPISYSAIVLKVKFSDILGKRYCYYYLISNKMIMFANEKYTFNLTCDVLTRKQFTKMMNIYKRQKCCGDFSEEYVPSYQI